MSRETILHFDLLRSAERKQIFGTVVAALPDACKGKVASVVDDASIRASEQLSHLMQVERAIDTTVAPDEAKERAKDVYRILAQAEAQVHGCSVEDTHFHEVGLGRTVREVLGICTAVELLGPERITATSVQVGSGTVECSHGLLDIPAPATAAILEYYTIPIAEERLEGELCTPTSAALIANLVKEFI